MEPTTRPPPSRPGSSLLGALDLAQVHLAVGLFSEPTSRCVLSCTRLPLLRRRRWRRLMQREGRLEQSLVVLLLRDVCEREAPNLHPFDQHQHTPRGPCRLSRAYPVPAQCELCPQPAAVYLSLPALGSRRRCPCVSCSLSRLLPDRCDGSFYFSPRVFLGSSVSSVLVLSVLGIPNPPPVPCSRQPLEFECG